MTNERIIEDIRIMYFEGYSPEEIAEHYKTIDPNIIVENSGYLSYIKKLIIEKRRLMKC